MLVLALLLALTPSSRAAGAVTPRAPADGATVAADHTLTRAPNTAAAGPFSGEVRVFLGGDP